MKPVEIVLRRQRGVKREKDLTKLYCKHICKYHNISPCTTIIC
jgi:hypothetical protein